MQSFILDRHTDPSNPVMKVTQDDKIPIYDSKADAEADIANIPDDGIVFTKDTGATEKVVDVVQDGNMNPVTSNAVADCLKYSTNETNTGKTWIDGKPIYRSVVDFGTLPNSTSKTLNLSINNLGNVVNLYGIADNSSLILPIPYVGDNSSGSDKINIYATKTQIVISALQNRSDFTAMVILEYTKTTN